MKKSLGPKTLLCPAPVVLVGTYDQDGKPNIMTAAWAGICCSKPVCVNVSLRAATYSHRQIVRDQAFTLNVPSATQVKEVDFVGMASGRDRDKFAELGWTAVKSELVNAPMVAEVPLSLECKVVVTNELGLHTQFVGQVMDVKLDEACLDEQGKLDPVKFDPLAFLPEYRQYLGLSRVVGPAFDLGKELLANKPG
ncbi:MAG: flavin reductase family protein [Desulfarculaceae bacterium]|nr:flavin reductase family protein [Desulfarculaceae bacterium]MCF8049273.1 flavin reductase family protein [Desulfarculaceae bacterium]MCF8066193.1 flavin reductase family protein [Desulfarculaceae bacterium]MCF8099766.1 flavin reductase family protein [Desulfarculaceae bacterium]MCF8122479.1 flavin reductase family protein [Desulfarculaceae bacterium]